MLESVLEKVLVNNLGPYVNGIDKKNLKVGILSGDVVIGNISIKPEAIAQLGLPIEIKQSHIGKLTLNLSWKNIASRPVEVVLEDVLIVVHPVNKESWTFDDVQYFLKRMDLVEGLVQSYAMKILQKAQTGDGKKKEEEDSGMIGRLTEKIIDNLQISIKNIHLRFENVTSKKKFACGITLEEILVYTTDQSWKKTFIDRTQAENKFLPMHKLLSLKNLGVYWLSDTNEIYGDGHPPQVIQNMRNFILRDPPTSEGQAGAALANSRRDDYIIALTATCKLIQKNKKSPLMMEKPEFDVSLQIPPLFINVKKPQLTDIIKLLTFLNKFDRFQVESQQAKQRQFGAISNEEHAKYKEQFQKMFNTLYRHPKHDEEKGEEKLKLIFSKAEEIALYKKIIMALPEEDILQIVKAIVKDVERDKQLKSLDDKKKDANKGWLGGWIPWGKGSNDIENEKDPVKKAKMIKDAEIQRQQELADIEKYLQEALEEGGAKGPRATEGEEGDKNLLALSFMMEGVEIYLSNIAENGNEEGSSFYLRGFAVQANIATFSKEVKIGLRDYGFVLKTKYAGTKAYNETRIFHRLKASKENQNILALTFEENPKGREEGMHIQLDMQEMEFIFRAIAMERLTKFFDVKVKDEDLKNQFAENLESVQNRAAEAANEVAQITVRKYITVNFAAPVIVIPFLQNGDLRSECWVLHLGNLGVSTKRPATELEKIYETYVLELQKVKFQYYPSQSLYNHIQNDTVELANKFKENETEVKRIFDVLEDFYMKVEVDKMLGEYEQNQGRGKPRMNVWAKIPRISLQLKPDIYANLLKTTDYLKSLEEVQMVLTEENYKNILPTAIKNGPLYLQERRLANIAWVKYECVFTKNAFYLYKQAHPDERPVYNFPIKDVVLEDQDLPEKENSFMIESKNVKTYFATENQSDKKEWTKLLHKKLLELRMMNMVYTSKLQVDFQAEAAKKKAEKDKEIEASKAIDHSVLEMQLKFEIKQVRLLVLRNEEQKLFDLETDNFEVNLKQFPATMNISMKLDAIESRDYLFEYTNPNLKMFLTSVPPGVNADETDEDLIDIQVVTMEKTHPDYHIKKTSTAVQLKLGYFFMNFKPGTLKAIMKFFIPAEDPNAQVVEQAQEEAQKVVFTNSEDDILMDISVDIVTIGVRLVHSTSYVCMAELALSGTKMFIQMRALSMELKGVFDNLQLFDLTNYPDTIDSNINYQLVRPYELFGANETSKDLIELSFKQYDPKHPKANLERNVFSFVDMNIRSVKINYLQQPILRIIDYLTGQLLPSLNPGGKAVSVSREIAEKTLALPQFMDLDIQMESPLITLKPRPDSEVYVEIRLGDIMVRSERVKDEERFTRALKPLPFVYCERYNIGLKDMGMFKVFPEEVRGQKKEVKVEISRRWNFEMFVEMAMFPDEYNLIHGGIHPNTGEKITTDISMKMGGKMTPMILTIKQDDYMLIMKCLNFNINYDDMLDRMLVSDYEKMMREQQEPGPPMVINLHIENLAILMLREDAKPFAVINWHKLDLNIQRDEIRQMSIEISGPDLTGSFFEYQDNIIQERKLLGNLDERNAFMLKDIPDHRIIDAVADKLKEYADTVAERHSVKEVAEVHEKKRARPVVIEMKMFPTGDKEIKIGVNQLRMYLATSAFLKIQAFTTMDDSVNPPLPKSSFIINEESFHNQQLPDPGRMKMNIEVDDIEIAIPSSKIDSSRTSSVLAIRGDVSLNMDNRAEPKLDAVLPEDRNKTYAKASDQCSDITEFGRMEIGLKEFEFFICDFNDLRTIESFKNVRKRNMILPLELKFSRISHMVPNQDKTGLIPLVLNNISMEKIIVRASYQDMLLMMTTSDYHQKQMAEAAKPVEENKEVLPKIESAREEVAKKSSREEREKTLEDAEEEEVDSQGPGPKQGKKSMKYVKKKDDPSDASALWNGDIDLSIQDEARALNPKEEEHVSLQIVSEKEVEVKKPVAKEEEGWEMNREDYVIESKGIKTALINDAEGLLVPVLEFNIEKITAAMSMIARGMNINGGIVFSCSYFNSMASKWEPIIEEFGADFDLGMLDNPKMSFSLATSKDFETLDINISQRMCSTLFSTMATWKTGFDEKAKKQDTVNRGFTVLSSQEQEVLDYVSPYSIVNTTGYPILVQCDQKAEVLAKAGKKAIELANQVYQIENEGNTQYRVESDIEDLVKESVFDEFLVNPNKIKVQVLHPFYQFREITGIDIDRPNVVAHPLTANGQQVSNSQHDFPLVVEVKVENEKKLIILTSPYRVKNHLDQELLVLLEANGQKLKISLHPEKSLTVPIDFIEGTITIQDAYDDSSTLKTPVKQLFGTGSEIRKITAGSINMIGEFHTLDVKKQVHKLRLLPPIQVKNCCVQDVQFRISSSKTGAEGVVSSLKPQQNTHETGFSLSQDVYMQVKAPGFNWSSKVLVHSPGQKEAMAQEMTLLDNLGRSLTICLFVAGETPKEASKQLPKKFFFYTKTSIINESPYDLEYFVMENNKQVKVPGQASDVEDLERGESSSSKLVMMNESKSFIIARRGESEISKKINIVTMGQNVAELYGANEQSLLELGIDITLKPCDSEHHIITKVITISPRYVVLNQTDCKIELRREKSSRPLLSLEKDGRTPLYWNSWEAANKDQNSKKKTAEPSSQKSISVHLVYPDQDPEYWNWSNPFDITSVGSYNFYVTNKNNTEIKFLRASVSVQASILYVLIDDEPEKDVSYKIRNDCPNFTIRAHQSTANPATSFVVNPNETIPYAWTYPNKKKEVTAHFQIDKAFNFHSSDLKFSFDNINQVFEVKIPESKDSQKKITVCVSVKFEEKSRILRFYIPKRYNAQKAAGLFGMLATMKEAVVNMDVEIGIKSIGISLISNLSSKKHDDKRVEVIYLLMRGLEVKMLETTETKSSQIRLKYMNIDNNIAFDTIFPVLLTPTNPGDLDADSKEYFLDVLVVQKNVTEIDFYEEIGLLLNATSLNVDGPFIEALLQVSGNFGKIFNANDESEEFVSITEGLYKNSKTATKLQDQEFFDSKATWKTSQIEKFKGNLFVKDLVINPFFFNLSFKLKKLTAGENSFVLFNLLTGALGTALANLDKAPLSLTGIKLNNVFDSQEAITTKIVSKYKDEIAKNVFKLLGSLDIVGNPVGLFKNISTGVVDLFEKPIEGFLKGPLEGGKGLVKGAGSLVKNTVSGAFNSISKVTGSLATGVSSLSMDDEYLEEREKHVLKRPKHVGQGLVQGGSSLLHGVVGGVTGIFVKPCRGAAAGGCKGFAKGTYQGVSGIVVKPVAGILDATSKTAEGIKNTATYWDKKANEERLRIPRPFYGKEKFYRTYRKLDAQILAALRNQKAELKDVALVGSVDVYPDDTPNDLFILAVTFGQVVYWNIKKSKIVWSFSPHDVEKAEILEGEIRFHLNKPAKGLKSNFVALKNPDQNENKFVYNKVLELKELPLE